MHKPVFWKPIPNLRPAPQTKDDPMQNIFSAEVLKPCGILKTTEIFKNERSK